MGGRRLILLEELIEKSDTLVELGTDWFEAQADQETLHSRVLQLRQMSVRLSPMVPLPETWARWSGGLVTDIYTDGSHAMDRTLGQFLLGKGSPKNGGGIILSDGRSWIHRIFVRIDVKVKNAFQVELICILIANAIAVAQGGRVVIHSVSGCNRCGQWNLVDGFPEHDQ